MLFAHRPLFGGVKCTCDCRVLLILTTRGLQGRGVSWKHSRITYKITPYSSGCEKKKLYLSFLPTITVLRLSRSTALRQAFKRYQSYTLTLYIARIAADFSVLHLFSLKIHLTRRNAKEKPHSRIIHRSKLKPLTFRSDRSTFSRIRIISIVISSLLLLL